MGEFAIRILNPEGGQFLRKIEWNAEEFAGWMQELSAQYADAVIVKPEDYKAAKQDRAKLNSYIDDIAARRIAVKKAVMEPYEKFEAELAEATASVKKVAEAIDKSIKDYEAAEKKAKKEKIRQIFEAEKKQPFYEKIDPKEMEFLEFDRLFNPRWLNASAKMSAVEKELNDKLMKVEEDLHTILSMDTDPACRAGALQEYRRTLDLGAALKAHADMQAMAQREQEAKRREEEERLRREAEEAERKRREDMAALRDRLSAEQAKTAAPPQQAGRAEAPVSGFAGQGYTNPRTMPQDAPQGQTGGRFGPSGGGDNESRFYGEAYSTYEGAPETGGVVPMGRQALPPQPPRQQPPAQPEKTFFVEFRVEGTRDQLMALREYMNNSGLRYGPVQKG